MPAVADAMPRGGTAFHLSAPPAVAAGSLPLLGGRGQCCREWRAHTSVWARLIGPGHGPRSRAAGCMVTRFPSWRDGQLFPEATIAPHRLAPHILRILAVVSLSVASRVGSGEPGEPWEPGFGGLGTGTRWAHRCEPRFLGRSRRRKQFSTELSRDEPRCVEPSLQPKGPSANKGACVPHAGQGRGLG